MKKINPVDAFIANATQASRGEKTMPSNRSSWEIEEETSSLFNTNEQTSNLEERVQRLEEKFDQILINLQGKSTTFNIALSNKQDAPISNSNSTDIFIYQEFENELSSILALLMDSKNPDVIQQFDSFKEELKSPSPKKGTIKGSSRMCVF